MKIIRWDQICHGDEHLHVATIEFKRMGSPPLHRHDFYECFLILEGDGQHHTNGGVDTLERHRIYFVRPEHEHAISGQKNLVFLNIAFEATTFLAATKLANFKSDCWKPGQPIHSESITNEQVTHLLENVVAVASRRDQTNAAWLILSIARILGEEQNATTRQSEMPDWMAKGLFRAADSTVITDGLSMLTHLMGRSREHIARSFQEHLSMTPTEWITQQRIKRACLLLSTTRLSVLDIALDCGFESSSYFHKSFRKMMQTTPRQYRTNLMRIQK